MELAFSGAPKGTRTPVAGVKGRSPRPLDDGSPIHFRMWNADFGIM